MLIAAASVLGSIGVCSAFGVKSTYIVLEVISFLVLTVMGPLELMKPFRSCIAGVWAIVFNNVCLSDLHVIMCNVLSPQSLRAMYNSIYSKFYPNFRTRKVDKQFEFIVDGINNRRKPPSLCVKWHVF